MSKETQQGDGHLSRPASVFHQPVASGGGMSRRTFMGRGLGLASLAVGGSSLLAACSGDSDEGKSSDPSSSGGGGGKRTPVDFWTWAHITAFPGYETNDIIKERFQDENPEYELNVRMFEYGDYVTALRTAVPQGEAGHVLALQPGAMIKQYAPYLVPLDDHAAEWFGGDWEQKFVASALSMLKNSSPERDSYLVLPSQLNVLGTMWYNVDLFEQVGVEVPQTYEELVEVSNKFKAADIIPIAWGAGDRWQNRDWLTTYASQFRPGAFEAAEAGDISFTDDAIAAAFEHMKRTIDDDIYNRGPFGTTAYPESMTMFWEKRAAMCNTGLHNHSSVTSVPGSLENWRAFSYPHIPDAPIDGWDSDLVRGVPTGTGPGSSRPIVDVAVSHGVSTAAKGAALEGAMRYVEWISSHEIQDWLSWWRPPCWADLGITGTDDAPPEYRDMLDWHYSIAPDGDRREFTYSEVRDAVETAVEEVMVTDADLQTVLASLDEVAETARS